MRFPGGGVRRGMGELLLNEHKVSILQEDGGNGCTTLYMCLIILSYTSKSGEGDKFVICIPQ